VQIYRKKFKYACEHADAVIAISQQTKNDIINFYKIAPEKITICYQSCNPSFSKTVSELEKERVRKLYNLPERYLLYVGSIIERKNLLSICKALSLLKNQIDVPLVVIGEGGSYKQEVLNYIKANNLTNSVIFLSDHPASQNASYKNAVDFPAIYQQALCMIYPSVFEGFGIPILEALWSKTPVITSNVSCMPETGGDAAYYVNPTEPKEIAEGISKILSNEKLVAEMKEKGLRHAQNFTPEKCAANVMDVYLRLL
jgi:glycosyltransferase involved in cell wall biosynthesis